MLRIFKYVFNPTPDPEIILPEGAQVLSVKEQNEEIVLYALVDPDKAVGWRRFKIIGTGHPIMDDDLDDYDFIDTVKLHKGKLMFHVFERRE